MPRRLASRGGDTGGGGDTCHDDDSDGGDTGSDTGGDSGGDSSGQLVTGAAGGEVLRKHELEHTAHIPHLVSRQVRGEG